MRIAITGPESSGKTTLAMALAEALGGVFIPEFAREYLLQLDTPYTQEDLNIIAKGQLKLWKASSEKPVVVCDTEMLVMHVWSEVSYQNTSSFILKSLGRQTFDHYFLCAPDIPWEEDPLREHPEMRQELFEIYLEKMEELGLPFSIISGDEEHRLKMALEVLKRKELK